MRRKYKHKMYGWQHCNDEGRIRVVAADEEGHDDGKLIDRETAEDESNPRSKDIVFIISHLSSFSLP